jgi:hydrogenase maturation protease
MSAPSHNKLVLGFGNFDRQDDGVAWHVLYQLAQRLGYPLPESPEDEFPPAAPGSPTLMFVLQLTPEMAESIAAYEGICFVDAHTGRVPEDVHVETLKTEFQSSPLTHHLTAESLLALAQSLYHAAPPAILVSVRGYQFGFSRDLSPDTADLANQAVSYIWNWLAAN